MKESSDDFSTKSCNCGSIMEQVVGFNHRSTDDSYQPYRVGWFCTDCKAFDQAILRERELSLK